MAAALAGSALLWSQSQAAAKEKESQKGQDSQQEEEDNESLQARHKKSRQQPSSHCTRSAASSLLTSVCLSVVPAVCCSAFDALQALLGDRISVDLEDRSGHGKDAYSYHSDKPPWAVVYPLSTEEVSAIARICYESRVVMIPYGSGTSLEGHTTAPSGGVVLDMSRMRALKAVHEQDMDAVVEPGISWGELNEQLKQYGLFYPVDPGPGASIGGMCGTSCSGTNAVRYGTMRYNVLNLTVVLADGTILKTAQRARKSSAGYSLTHLFIGSEGTLGVITEATLRLQNIPEQTAVAVCAFPSVHHAAGAAIAVMRKGVQVGCVELLDEVCVKIVNGYVGLSLPEKPTIFFKFHGSAAGVKDEVERVQQAIKPFQPGAFDWATEAEKRDRIWEGRKGALWATMAYRPEAQVWTTDVCLPISRLADCIEATKKDIEQSGLLAPIVGHVGDGNFHVMLSVDPGNEEEMRVAQGINQRMVQRAIQMEGTCTGEHGVGVGKRDYLDHELGVTTVETMRRVKAALDPFGLMNPGKSRPARQLSSAALEQRADRPALCCCVVLRQGLPPQGAD